MPYPSSNGQLKYSTYILLCRTTIHIVTTVLVFLGIPVVPPSLCQALPLLQRNSKKLCSPVRSIGFLVTRPCWPFTDFGYRANSLKNYGFSRVFPLHSNAHHAPVNFHWFSNSLNKITSSSTESTLNLRAFRVCLLSTECTMNYMTFFPMMCACNQVLGTFQWWSNKRIINNNKKSTNNVIARSLNTLVN